MDQDSKISSPRRTRAPREFGLLWSPIFVPLLFIAAGLSIPYGFGRVAYWKWREKQFAKKMATSGRVIDFDKLVRKLERGEGTVIHEWYTVYKGPVHHWWTPDDVLTMSPYPCVDRLAMARHRYRPLVEWFFRQYTSPVDGKALFFVINMDQKKTWAGLKEKSRVVDVPTFSRQNW